VPSERTSTATVSPLSDDRLDGHVQIGKLLEQPLGGATHRARPMDPARFCLSKGRLRMLHEVLGHRLVTGVQVLSIEDLLEVSPDQVLGGLDGVGVPTFSRHGRPPSLSFLSPLFL
jgi:hypothetical protein